MRDLRALLLGEIGGLERAGLGIAERRMGVLLVIVAGRRGAWICYLELGIGRQIYIISLSQVCR